MPKPVVHAFKFCLIILITQLSLDSFAQQHHINSKDPHALIESVGEKTFSRVKNERPLLLEDKQHYRVIVEQELLPYVDYQYAALKALGKKLRSLRLEKDSDKKAANKKQLTRFVENFKQYLITVYAGVFTQYTNQRVIYEPARETSGRKITLVRATIVETDKPNIRLAFKLRKQKNGEWAAYDMLVEGISLLDAKQAELDNLFKQYDLEKVTDILAERANREVSFNH